VAAIEREVFADPWSADDFRECVAGGVPFAVATTGTEIMGYVVAHQAADEGEILNLGVARLRRRRGIGRALVQHMLGELRRRGVVSVYLEVRESNTGARRLYRSLGFVGVGRRPGYYRRPIEDAVILRTVISAVGENA
jgi:ribosomal-protein-alanine N-acetyltransferase